MHNIKCARTNRGNTTGEIAATEYNNGVGIDWSNTHFSLYPWWLGSVAEAVFLLGAERNADKIIGTTYVSSVSDHVQAQDTNDMAGAILDEPGQLRVVANHDLFQLQPRRHRKVH
jgi:hypothetical protein